MSLRLSWIILIVSVLLSINTYGQKLENGLYTMRDNDLKHHYLKISNDSFYLFTLEDNHLRSTDLSGIIKVGRGKYDLSQNSFILNFDTGKRMIEDFTKDSIQASFSSKPHSNTIDFNVELKYGISTHDNSALVIRTASKDFFYQIKGGTLSISVPDSLIIEEVYLSMMGFEKKSFPYDGKYNTFSYVYHINDSSIDIEQISGGVWNLPFKRSKSKDYILTSGSFSYLKKAEAIDIELFKKATLSLLIYTGIMK